MSGSNDIDEKRFQDDLEKAKALSLETLAMEKFRMQNLYKHSITKTTRESVDASKPPVADSG